MRIRNSINDVSVIRGLIRVNIMRNIKSCSQINIPRRLRG